MVSPRHNYVTVSDDEATDRLAIRELVEAFAHYADRRDAKSQMALFTPDRRLFMSFMSPGAKDPAPSLDRQTRESLAPVFAELDKYDSTTHIVSQVTILTLTANEATGETYYLAHHIAINASGRRLTVASLRYRDVFAKIDGQWLFAERRLYVDWVEVRTLS
jgi:ketosteroid isomerase-like protein